MALSTLDQVDVQLKDIIQNLYSLIVQVHDYPKLDTAGTNIDSKPKTTADTIIGEVTKLIQNLVTFARTSRTLDVAVPPEIIEYVENGRNPDIYTREFVEVAQRMNQQLKGKSEAFAQFGDALAREIRGAIPELESEVEKVLMQTKGGARSLHLQE